MLWEAGKAYAMSSRRPPTQEIGSEMIKITNGNDTYTVTRGAYETVYKGMGFYPVGQEPVVQSTGGDTPDVDEAVTERVEDAYVEAVDASAGPIEAEEPEESEDETWCKSIRQKPISQWNKQELKRYATLNGIDTSDARTVNDVRSKIAASWA